MPMLLRACAADAGLRWHDGGGWGLADSDHFLPVPDLLAILQSRHETGIHEAGCENTRPILGYHHSAGNGPWCAVVRINSDVAPGSVRHSCRFYRLGRVILARVWNTTCCRLSLRCWTPPGKRMKPFGASCPAAHDHLRTKAYDETLPSMSDLPRYWTLKTRKPLHPTIPTRAREWLLFFAAALFLVAAPLYILSGYIRHLLTADEAVQMCLSLWFGGGVFVVLGTLCRWWRLKKLRMHVRSKRNLAVGLSEPD